jgi:hypothetical protein
VIIGDSEAVRRVVLPAVVAGLALLSSAPAEATTDEDQVRAVLDSMNGSYNRTDFTGFAAHPCANRTDAKTFDVEFRRDGADWKARRYEAGQYI